MLRLITHLKRLLVLTFATGLLLSAQDAAKAGTPGGFRAAVKRAVPAVVSVISTKTSRFSDEERKTLREIFRDTLPRQDRRRDLGSGVVVSADGYILTNEHVVANAKDIRILFPDRREFKARLVGGDAGTDIAVLKIEAAGLPFLELM